MSCSHMYVVESFGQDFGCTMLRKIMAFAQPSVGDGLDTTKLSEVKTLEMPFQSCIVWYKFLENFFILCFRRVGIRQKEPDILIFFILVFHLPVEGPLLLFVNEG